MGAYKVRQYCPNCRQTVNATMYMNTEWIDGRAYESGVDRVVCDVCGSTEVTDYDACPICNASKSESAQFCDECYNTTSEYIAALKKALGASDGDLEEIVCNCLGI